MIHLCSRGILFSRAGNRSLGGRSNMELMDAIRTRHSVRTFDGTPVDRETVDRVIGAATYAPSRFNVQPWQFHVATGAARKRVAEVMALNTAYVQEYLSVYGPRVIEHAARFYADLGGAPVVIGISSPAPEDEMWAVDDYLAVGAAMQNVLLAATDQGISVCSITAPHWIRDKLLDVFEVPEGSDLLAMIVMGYGEEEPHEKPRRTDVVTYLK